MFKTLLSLIVVCCAFHDVVRADEADHLIDAARVEAAKERRAIVEQNLPLDENSDEFWSIYDEYRGEMERHGSALVALIKDYSARFETMDEETARELTDRWLFIQSQDLETRRRYVRQFREVLPEIQVARLIQIENKIDAVFNWQLSQQVSLIEPAAAP